MIYLLYCFILILILLFKILIIMNLRVLRSSLDSLSITKIKKYMALKYVNILINLDKIKIIYNLYKYNIILIFINLWENNKNIGRQNMLLQYPNTHSLNLNLKYRGHSQGRGIFDSRETSMRSPTTCGWEIQSISRDPNGSPTSPRSYKYDEIYFELLHL